MGLGLPTGAIPASFFGMNCSVNVPWFTVPVGAQGKASGVTWKSIETSAGVFSWTVFDAWAAAAVAKGVPLLYSFDSWPEFYSYPTNLQKLYDFAALVVARMPVGSAYELWNEPYTLGSYHIGVAVTNQAMLVAMTAGLRTAILAADPTAVICAVNFQGGAGASGSSYMDAYFAAGGTTQCSIVPLHAYPDASLGLDPEGFNFDRYLLSGISTILTTYGLTGKDLWLTEGSWNQAATYTPALTTDQQVAFIARWLMMLWSNGFVRQFWYAWDNQLFGSLNAKWSLSHKPAVAWLQMYRWLVGATMTAAAAVISGTKWSCAFSRPGGYTALAVWDTSGDSSYTPTGPWVQYRGLDGSKTAWSSGAVTIGIKPLLFESADNAIERRVGLL